MLDAIARETGCTIAPYAPQDRRPMLRWARSGLMALSGPRDGAPLIAPRDYCGRIEELAHGVRAFARAAGFPLAVDASVVTERAALLNLSRAGTVSANGTCRIIPAGDGWLAVNLPRADDRDLLPAWIGSDPGGDFWPRLEASARASSSTKLTEDAQLLGLAVGHVHADYAVPPLVTRMTAPASPAKKPPVVLDMSSLWAGPLCGALLADAGAQVIKLESRSRPDGAKFGSPAVFSRLNGGKRAIALDLPRDRATLRELFARVDIVIESARPRVLSQWGFSLPEIFAANPRLIWISVTAYGRGEGRGNWVGFGDDVAAAAGLVIESEGRPMFVGDAIADPLAGLAGAASAFACLAAGGGFVVDASLFAAAAFVAAAPGIEEAAAVEKHGDAWMLRLGECLEPIAVPAAKPVATAPPPPLGADTEMVLREVLR